MFVAQRIVLHFLTSCLFLFHCSIGVISNMNGVEEIVLCALTIFKPAITLNESIKIVSFPVNNH